MSTADVTQVPTLYRRQIGEITVTAIGDGYVDVPVAALVGIEGQNAERVLTSTRRPVPPRVSVNCYLLQANGRTALVDTGAGDTMGPTLGKLTGLLGTLGISPSDIDTIFLTHMHPDHSNGLTLPDGKPVFERAELVVSETDVAHWFDDGARSQAMESHQIRYFDGARFQIGPYQSRRRQPGPDIFPGVNVLPLPGHTPGHTGYVMASGEETLLIWGDICHVPDIQIPHPEVAMMMDTDPDAAVDARRRALDFAATDELLIAGMHLHFPGFSYVTRSGDGYRLIPEAWAFVP